ncbi:MAG: DNA polymerase IV [Firmicutes bacterium]|nr:DNA polymerase IV [Bacillota bacterium]
MKDRTILHCDMNSFYCSVELLEHPELRDKPTAVCGDPEGRHGIILAKNEAAKKYGIKTAETVWQAKRKCPDLNFLPPHHDKYHHYYQLINAIYQQYTDLVEPFSVDESWLDVTGSRRLFGSGVEIADEIRARVKRELGLTLSAGVSFNKIFAKMGSEYKKPDATTLISRENYRDLLWPLPVGEMFFVGFATAEKLKGVGIKTIGELANADRASLQKLLGKQGPVLIDYAAGRDESPVALFSQRDQIKSVGNGITFRRDLTSESDILTALTGLSDTVAGRLRKHQLKCGGVKVDIRDPQFNDVSRQRQIEVPTNLATEIKQEALAIIRSFWPAGKPIRQITVTAINLCGENDDEQLSFFGTGGTLLGGAGAGEKQESASRESVERTMDEIRAKFGKSAIQFGQVIDNDIGLDV